MASKASKNGSAGGGPGTATAGQVKSTMAPVFGARVAGSRKGAKRSTSRRASAR